MVHKIGTNAVDILEGTNGNDWLEGLNSNDSLFGYLGDDTLDGGSGLDFVVYTQSTNGVTVDLAAGTATGEGADTLISIENVDGSMKSDTIFLTTGQNFANGNGGNDVIYGRGSTALFGDTILGGTGKDKIYAGDGNQMFLDGQEGNDYIEVGEGTATVVGGSGTDTLSYKAVDMGLLIDLESGTVRDSYSYPYELDHQIYEFENVDGTAHADHVWGDSGDNRLRGLGGNDAIYGNDGDDRVEGGGGHDALYGGLGDDELYGGGGNDVLYGGELMVGGTGKDIMHGFSQANLFRFDAVNESAVGANRDQIVDFFRSEGDKIDLSGLDAKTTQGGNQAFTFIGANAFSAAGQVRVIDQGGGKWLVQASTDGDLQPEFEVEVSYTPAALGAQDFIL